MKKFALTTALILGAASWVAACTTSATDLPEGEYEKRQKAKMHLAQLTKQLQKQT